MRATLTPFATWAVCTLCIHGQAATAADAIEVQHSLYVADQPFPDFAPLWGESWRTGKDANGEATHYIAQAKLGGYTHVFIRNATDKTVSITDTRIEGIGLDKAIILSPDEHAGLHPASIRISKLPKEQIDRLRALGEPVWWQAAPDSIAPGGYGEVTVRLRRKPGEAGFNMQVVCGDTTTTPTRVEVDKPQPWIAGIAFAPDFGSLFTYVHKLDKASAPERLSIDGKDVTARSKIFSDSNIDTALIVTRLTKPLERGSWHCYNVDFAGGGKAMAGVRAFADEFRYGMWGYVNNNGKTAKEKSAPFLHDMLLHGINALMYSYGEDVTDFLLSDEGRAFSDQTGLELMATWPGNIQKPVYYFLQDEPDAHDASVSSFDPDARLGALAQALVQRSRQIRKRDAAAPILLNIDNTYKPENWYCYAQMPDFYCADPYYSGELATALSRKPWMLPAHEKPTYVYGVSTICRYASAPRPLHIILNCVRNDEQKNPFRFSTAVEKRIEAYYAIAGGATALSYWWYTPYGACHGVGNGDDPQGRTLWREMGLIGAELRTAGEVLVKTCPVELPVEASKDVWVRTLLAGDDTLVVVVVNDTSRGNKTGTTIRDVSPAKVTIDVPDWLTGLSGIVVDAAGVKALRTRQTGNHVELNLPQLRVTQLILLTRDAKLRERLGKVYREQFAAKVKQLRSAR